MIETITENLQNNILKKNNKLLYNLKQLNLLANNNDQFVKNMILLFIDETEIALKEITEAQEKLQSEVIRKVIHKMKPSIETMGITTIKQEIKEILANKDIAFDESFSLKSLKIIRCLKDAIEQLKNNFNYAL